jgi:hypothetical protein
MLFPHFFKFISGNTFYTNSRGVARTISIEIGMQNFGQMATIPDVISA